MRAEGYVSERGLMGLRENEAEAYHPTAEIFDKVLNAPTPTDRQPRTGWPIPAQNQNSARHRAECPSSDRWLWSNFLERDIGPIG